MTSAWYKSEFPKDDQYLTLTGELWSVFMSIFKKKIWMYCIGVIPIQIQRLEDELSSQKSFETKLQNVTHEKQLLEEKVADLEFALAESEANANVTDNIDTSGKHNANVTDNIDTSGKHNANVTDNIDTSGKHNANVTDNIDTSGRHLKWFNFGAGKPNLVHIVAQKWTKIEIAVDDLIIIWHFTC